MMTPSLAVLSPDQIDAERERLLTSTRMSLDELQAKADVYALTPAEQGILDQVEDLEYLGRASRA